MNMKLIADIVDGITEAADELLKIENRNDVESGELIAYAESLCIIRDTFSGYDLSEIGLNFDIDGRYLQ